MSYNPKGYGSFYSTSSQPHKNPDIESKLAKELQRQKLETESKRREIEKVCAESEEIKQLKEKIKAAYLNKERSVQIAETQIRKLDDIRKEAEVEDYMLKFYAERDQREKDKDIERKMKQLVGKDVLMYQMDEKKQKSAEAYENYVKERSQVDQVVHKIIQEDLEAFETDKVKKAKAYGDMLEAFELKKQNELKQKEIEQKETQKYLEFLHQKEKREEAHRAQKAELEAAKDQIYQKILAEQTTKMREREMLEDLRFTLQQEEFEANERKKERDELEKKIRFKELMIQAEREDLAAKQARKEDEERAEREYKRNMLAKFAADDKIEQLSQQKRRMKELEHKKEVERLWKDKLETYQMEREREILEAKIKLQEMKQREEIIKQEKERLLQEHLAQLQGFYPKGILQGPEDTKFATRK